MTDTGRLYSAGWFRQGIRADIKRFWPVRLDEPEEGLELARRVLEKPVVPDGTLWLDDREFRVVADFPRDFFLDRVTCVKGRNDTTVMALWILH